MKLDTFIILILFTQTLFAQEATQNHNYIAGGTMNFLYQKNAYPLSNIGISTGIGTIYSNTLNDFNNTVFGIQPYVGKVVSPKWTLGLKIDYTIQRYKAFDAVIIVGGSMSGVFDVSQNSNQIGGGLFARYTFNPQQRLNIYLQPAASYNFYNLKYGIDNELRTTEQTNYLLVNADVGLLYGITERLNVNLRLGALNFLTGRRKIEDMDVVNSFSSFNANFRLSNLSFGMEFKL